MNEVQLSWCVTISMQQCPYEQADSRYTALSMKGQGSLSCLGPSWPGPILHTTSHPISFRWTLILFSHLNYVSQMVSFFQIFPGKVFPTIRSFLCTLNANITTYIWDIIRHGVFYRETKQNNDCSLLPVVRKILWYKTRISNKYTSALIKHAKQRIN